MSDLSALFDDDDEPEVVVVIKPTSTPKAKVKSKTPKKEPKERFTPTDKIGEPTYLEITTHTLTHPAKCYETSKAILMKQRQ